MTMFADMRMARSFEQDEATRKVIRMGEKLGLTLIGIGGRYSSVAKQRAAVIERRRLRPWSVGGCHSGRSRCPDFVVSDYYDILGLGIPSKSPPKAERASATVAAASIVAKVVLDQMMVDFDRQFPQWGFAGNNGYRGNDGKHAAALAAHGPSPIHRLSSKGVQRALQGWKE